MHDQLGTIRARRLYAVLAVRAIRRPKEHRARLNGDVRENGGVGPNADLPGEAVAQAADFEPADDSLGAIAPKPDVARVDLARGPQRVERAEHLAFDPE